MSTMSTTDSDLPTQVQLIERFEILGQPCCKSKLRYRSDFETKRNRRAVLCSNTNANHPSPTIRIPPSYLNFSQHYYIRISLVTIPDQQNQLRYIHPYDLEDANNHEYNDRPSNAVWFPIKEEDSGGLKSFPNLRIVKKTENELKKYGNLRVFDSPNSFATFHAPLTPKEIIKQFHLDRQQLTFSLGQKTITDNILTSVVFAVTTVFSNEIIQIGRQITDSLNISTNPTTTASHTPKVSFCELYKYGPKEGYPEKHNEIFLIYTEPINLKKYENVQISFEYDTPHLHWSKPVLDLVVNDRVISFNTPSFPYSINTPTTVNIVVKQKKRSFAILQFQYIPQQSCSKCEKNPSIVVPANPNKRLVSEVYSDETETNTNEFSPITDIALSPSLMFPDLFPNPK